MALRLRPYQSQRMTQRSSDETRPRKSDGIYRAARRGASTHMRDRVEAVATALREADRIGDPAKLRVRETRQELERGWLAASESLRSQGQTALTEQTRHFVRNLPPARTEREWLLAALVEQVPVIRRLERANDKARGR